MHVPAIRGVSVLAKKRRITFEICTFMNVERGFRGKRKVKERVPRGECARDNEWVDGVILDCPKIVPRQTLEADMNSG